MALLVAGIIKKHINGNEVVTMLIIYCQLDSTPVRIFKINIIDPILDSNMKIRGNIFLINIRDCSFSKNRNATGAARND